MSEMLRDLFVEEKKQEEQKIKQAIFKSIAKETMAEQILKWIEEAHSRKFIEEYLATDKRRVGSKRYNNGEVIRARYKKLLSENPAMSTKEVRGLVCLEFKITDKAVQNHIYPRKS